MQERLGVRLIGAPHGVRMLSGEAQQLLPILIAGHGENDEPAAAQVPLQLVKVRQLLTARPSPSCPIIEEHDVTA